MRAAQRGRIPYVVTFHSGGHSSRLRRALRPTHQRLLAPLVRGAARAIGVSEFERAYFERLMELGPGRTLVITNGVSEEFRTVVRPTNREVPVIASVGRLERYKGHQHVIAALPHVRRRVPSARLRVIGDGPGGPALRDLAARLGVEAAVDFESVPYGDRRTLASRMAEADVIALLSSYESQGIAGLEALATGARLIVADGSALNELDLYGPVRVVPRSDPQQVAAVIVEQLELPSLVLRPRVPSWDDVADEIEQLYGQVLAETAPRVATPAHRDVPCES
jgi:glycogen synthase